MMNQFKTRGEVASRSESFVELCIDDLVRESVTWPAQTKSGFGFSEPLPNVIHRPLVPPELH
jgi:hypothetical protein